MCYYYSTSRQLFNFLPCCRFEKPEKKPEGGFCVGFSGTGDGSEHGRVHSSYISLDFSSQYCFQISSSRIRRSSSGVCSGKDCRGHHHQERVLQRDGHRQPHRAEHGHKDPGTAHALHFRRHRYHESGDQCHLLPGREFRQHLQRAECAEKTLSVHNNERRRGHSCHHTGHCGFSTTSVEKPVVEVKAAAKPEEAKATEAKATEEKAGIPADSPAVK